VIGIVAELDGHGASVSVAPLSPLVGTGLSLCWAGLGSIV